MTKKEHEISPNLEKARAYERRKEMEVGKERDDAANKISFVADGLVRLNVTKYEIK